MTVYVWDSAFKAASITQSNGDLTATDSASGATVSTRTTVTIPASVKIYVEFTVISNGGSTGWQVGLVPSTHVNSNFVSVTGSGYFQGNAASGIFNQGGNGGTLAQFRNTPPSYVIGMAIDLVNTNFWACEVDSVWSGSGTGTGNPATNTLGHPLTFSAAGPYYIAYAATQNDAVIMNATGPFSFTPPAGFAPASNAPFRPAGLVREALIVPNPIARIGKTVRETLYTTSVPLRSSGIIRETLVSTKTPVFNWNHVSLPSH